MDVRFLISSLHLWLSEASPDQKTISYQHHSLRYTRAHALHHHVCIFHPPSSNFYRFPHPCCLGSRWGKKVKNLLHFMGLKLDELTSHFDLLETILGGAEGWRFNGEPGPKDAANPIIGTLRLALAWEVAEIGDLQCGVRVGNMQWNYIYLHFSQLIEPRSLVAMLPPSKRWIGCSIPIQLVIWRSDKNALQCLTLDKQKQKHECKQ